MATSDVNFCSQALVLLGANPIASFTEETDPARICAQTYPDFKKFILGHYPWRFTMTKKELTRETAAPTNEWLYSFILPSDRLEGGAWAVFDSADQGARSITEFEIFQNKLYSNKERIWIDYQTAIAESKWPATFNQFALSAFRAQIAFAITDQQNTADHWHVKAWGTPGDEMQGGLFYLAQLSDGQSNAAEEMNSDDLVEVRAY